MTSFLFVVRIPKAEKNSEEKPECNENRKKVDNEVEEVSKDADQGSSGNADPTKTEKPESDQKGDKPGAEVDDEWDFGEDDGSQSVEEGGVLKSEGGEVPKSEGGEVPKSEGEVGDSPPVREEGTSTGTRGITVHGKDVGKTRDLSIVNGGVEIRKDGESTGQGTTAQNTAQGVLSAETVIPNDKPQVHNVKQEGNDATKTMEPGKQGNVGGRAAEDNSEQSVPPPKKTFTVEAAAEDSLKTDTENKQRQLVQQGNSNSAPALHTELSVPKSLSDDRLSAVETKDFETVSFLEEEPLIEVYNVLI